MCDTGFVDRHIDTGVTQGKQAKISEMCDNKKTAWLPSSLYDTGTADSYIDIGVTRGKQAVSHLFYNLYAKYVIKKGQRGSFLLVLS